MTDGGKSTEWLDLMLGELEQRRRERREAEEEAARRVADRGVAMPDDDAGREPAADPAARQSTKARGR